MLKNERRFTLVELLVVIAIISLLATMLFPCMQKAMGDVRMVSCTNNMRTLGLGLSLYAGDNPNYIPSTYIQGAGNPCNWPIAIRNYIGMDGSDIATTARYNEILPERSSPKGLFLCPETQPNSAGIMRYSYAVTSSATSEARSKLAEYKGGFDVYNTGNGITGRDIPKKRSVIPTGSIILTEAEIMEPNSYSNGGMPMGYTVSVYQSNILGYPYYTAKPSHAGGRKSNFLIIDGSVRSRAFVVCSTGKLSWEIDTNWRFR